MVARNLKTKRPNELALDDFRNEYHQKINANEKKAFIGFSKINYPGIRVQNSRNISVTLIYIEVTLVPFKHLKLCHIFVCHRFNDIRAYIHPTFAISRFSIVPKFINILVLSLNENHDFCTRKTDVSFLIKK